MNISDFVSKLKKKQIIMWVINLIGKEKLVSDFSSNRALPLVSIKCSPYNIAGKAVIMGDAAHAMVPFYGQGMNCGMEDCLVLEDALDKHKGDLEKSLEEYSINRNPDAEAMCDLAMYNYIEVITILLECNQISKTL